ncbi:MAG: hypothetical protein IC227_05110 [Enterococcus lacertideformus]|uniref:Uncharacterized protein n=1 Tax=Enterococcus lacertideformus TaxID=2771493 RepID=A0A931F8H1_9ENTE|nr:hypothetical protein [Enterococcus lacertideformus]
MEIDYQVQEEKAKIYYGETLASQLKTIMIDQPILFLTNQRYYDLFADKINQKFLNPSEIDWYICANTQCNHLTELSNLVTFAKRYPESQSFLIIGFGNEGVMDLAGFFQKHTSLTAKLWLIPVSIRSMARALTPQRMILQLPNQVVLQTDNLPERIVYDQTISEKQGEGKQIDFLVLICCGIICDYRFLQNLYKNYPMPHQLAQRPLTGMLEEMISFYQDSADNLSNYGKLFEQAFYLTENGHLLSASMKRLLGILFHLLWNVEVSEMTFQLKNFFIWLKHLNYPIEWPDHISKIDYLENVLNLANKSKKILVLKKIGIIERYQTPNEHELVQVMTSYEKIISEIRGI